jgi:aldose 1-epimerase
MAMIFGRFREHRAVVLVVSLAMVAVTTSSTTLVLLGRGAGAAGGLGLSVSMTDFGSTVEPYTGKVTEVDQYTLKNGNGMSVQILTYGGIVQDINVPGQNGPADVVLGFKSLSDYVTFDSPPVTSPGGPYFGEILGRYANRIADGKFTLNQPGIGPVTYTVPVNDGTDSLNGGLVGFGDHVWSGQAVQGHHFVGVQLTLTSPNGDDAGPAGSPGCPAGCTGFPAELTVVVTYTLDDKNDLTIEYQATNDSSNLNTVVNLTNDSYFNLAGESSPAGSAYGQQLQINGDTYLPTDASQIPLGTEPSVSGTPFAFLKPESIGSRIDEVSAPDNSTGIQLLIAQGYDHNWILNPRTPATTGPDDLGLAATASDKSSGRTLTVWTDQPGLQFTTGNGLDGTLIGIDGNTYRQGAGYTLATQHFPDSVNEPDFPSTVLDAGSSLTTTTVYQFTW